MCGLIGALKAKRNVVASGGETGGGETGAGAISNSHDKSNDEIVDHHQL